MWGSRLIFARELARTSASLATGEEWRWTNHLGNVPLYYEYKDKDITDAILVNYQTTIIADWKYGYVGMIILINW